MVWGGFIQFGVVSGQFLGLFPGVSGLCFGEAFQGISGGFGEFWGGSGNHSWFWGVSGWFGRYFIRGCSRAIFWGVSGKFWGVSGLFEGDNLGHFWAAFWGISARSRAAFGGILRHFGCCRSVLGCQAIGGCFGASRRHFGMFFWGMRAAF